jgi:hypothetical protein
MGYVDAGYAIALGTLFVYAISLVLRRRRWERALRMSATPTPASTPPAQTSPLPVPPATAPKSPAASVPAVDERS